MDPARSLRDASGFTLVEVIVAMVLLLVGILGTMTMFDAASAATTTSKAREQAVALQREVVEAVRAVPYAQLANGSVVGRVQAQPALADASSAAGWTIRRRGVTFAVSAGVCSVDDAQDGLGAHHPDFCASGAGQTSAADCRSHLGRDGDIAGIGTASGVAIGDCGIDVDRNGAVNGLTAGEVSGCTAVCAGGGAADTNPDDYKRLVVLVRWDRGDGQRFVLSSATVPYPGLAFAPSVTAITPTVGATSVAFSATTSRDASALGWTVDGTPTGAAAGGPLTWTWTWALGTVSAGAQPDSGQVVDGLYRIAGKAFDAYGAYGQERTATVALNRNAPYPPQGFGAGRDGSVVLTEWIQSRERDIEGYRVKRRVGAGAEEVVTSCDRVSTTACRDSSPPTAPSVEYWVVALDRDAGAVLREGAPSTVATVTTSNTPPSAPGTLSVTRVSSTQVRLDWGVASDPDAGDAIRFYRIYRDGETTGDRYDRTPLGTQVTYLDIGATGGHRYRVSAVDGQLGESVLSNEVVIGP